ncbi:MAG TPA: CbiQ family ECF transporter T component, partial [Acidimicrobiales bacterium]
MATAASRTTNPILLALVIAVVGFVVARRRSEAQWAVGFRAYLVMGVVILAIRIVFRAVLGGGASGHVLFTLPQIPLPKAAAGIRLGGPVSLEGVLAALYDGLRLAALLICVGAANLLADPKRLLKSLPSALSEVGTAATVSLSVAPQLIESGRRIARARRLRGDDSSGRRKITRLVRRVAIPVATDALDRSLTLAAAMDSRGYGRRQQVPVALRRVSGSLVLGGLVGVCVGTYGLLDATTPRLLGLPMLLVGLGLATGGFVIAGRRLRRTRYRPDPWRGAEWAVAGCGLLVAIGMSWLGRINPADLNPSLQPLTWPVLPLGPVIVVLLGGLPGWLAPPVAVSRPTKSDRVIDATIDLTPRA